MYGFLLALIYIAFISLGLPDSLLGSGWPVMHEEFNVPISFMGIVSMVISGGTIVSSLLSDRLTKKLGTPRRDRRQRVSHRDRTSRLFLFRSVLDAHRLFRSVRVGGGRNRRCVKQLRRTALQVQTHELAALFLGGRDDRQPVYHGICPDKFYLAQRLSHRRIDTVGDRNPSRRYFARLESQ